MSKETHPPFFADYRAASEQKIQNQKKEVGNWIPGRNNLRLNLDALRADRRQDQIQAVLQSAGEAHDFTIGLQKKERDEVQFVLRTNAIRLIEQVRSETHTAGSVDRFFRKLLNKAKGEVNHRTTPDISAVAAEMKVAKLFLQDQSSMLEIFGEDGLRSTSINDADKEVVLRNIQRLFRVLEQNVEGKEQADRAAEIRHTIASEVARVLPKLSPVLQEIAMQQMAGLQVEYKASLQMKPDVDGYATSAFLEGLTPSQFAALDEQAKITFLENVRLDAYTGKLLADVLKEERNVAVLEASTKAFSKIDPSDPPSSRVRVGYGRGSFGPWASIPDAEKQRNMKFFQEQTLVQIAELPFAPSTGYEVVKVLDAYAAQGGRKLGEQLMNAEAHISVLQAIPGYYAENFQKATRFQRENVVRDFRESVAAIWLRFSELSGNDRAQNALSLVRVLGRCKQVHQQMVPGSRFRNILGSNYLEVRQKYQSLRGRDEQEVAKQLEKLVA